MNLFNIFNLTITASELSRAEWTTRCVVIFVVLAVAIGIFAKIAEWWNSRVPKQIETKHVAQSDDFFFGELKDIHEFK